MITRPPLRRRAIVFLGEYLGLTFRFFIVYNNRGGDSVPPCAVAAFLFSQGENNPEQSRRVGQLISLWKELHFAYIRVTEDLRPM